MKHAGPDTLDQLSSLLAELRELSGLVEKRRGVFYRRSRAFLHFHEDPAGIFVDVRLADDFERHAVTTASQRKRLLSRVRAALRRLG